MQFKHELSRQASINSLNTANVLDNHLAMFIANSSNASELNSPTTSLNSFSNNITNNLTSPSNDFNSLKSAPKKNILFRTISQNDTENKKQLE